MHRTVRRTCVSFVIGLAALLVVSELHRSAIALSLVVVRRGKANAVDGPAGEGSAAPVEHRIAH